MLIPSHLTTYSCVANLPVFGVWCYFPAGVFLAGPARSRRGVDDVFQFFGKSANEQHFVLSCQHSTRRRPRSRGDEDTATIATLLRYEQQHRSVLLERWWFLLVLTRAHGTHRSLTVRHRDTHKHIALPPPPPPPPPVVASSAAFNQLSARHSTYS